MLGILDGIVGGTKVAISITGRGVRRATTVGNHVGLDNGMGNGGGDGTGEVCSFVGAGVGVDDGSELCDGDCIVGGLKFDH